MEAVEGLQVSAMLNTSGMASLGASATVTGHYEGAAACFGGISGSLDTPWARGAPQLSRSVGRVRPIGGMAGYAAAGPTGTYGAYINMGMVWHDVVSGIQNWLKGR